MAFGKKQSPSDEETSGLKAELSSFLQDASSYLQIRGKLFSVEAKEAGQAYGKKIGLILGGGLFLIFGYFLMLAGGIGFIGTMLDSATPITLKNWIGGAFILAAGHLIMGIILLKIGLKTKVEQGLFEYTRNEFQKEQEWLKQKKERS